MTINIPRPQDSHNINDYIWPTQRLPMIFLSSLSGFALSVDRRFYTEESAYLKLQTTDPSQRKQFAAWEQECQGETTLMSTLS